VEQLKLIFWKQDIAPVSPLPPPTLLAVVADAVPDPVVPEVVAVDQPLQSTYFSSCLFWAGAFFIPQTFIPPAFHVRFSGKTKTHSLTLRKQVLFSPS
jgi:hypothetical protein